MPRSSEMNYYSHEDMGKALRWLREHRRGMTRKAVSEMSEVIAQLTPHPVRVSTAYLRKLEIGERDTISLVRLDTLLEIYGSTTQELVSLIASQPWSAQAAGGWQPTAATPDPSVYRQAAAQALSAHTGTWSSAVDDPSQERLIQGQATELVEYFVRMSAAQRKQLLDDVRQYRHG